VSTTDRINVRVGAFILAALAMAIVMIVIIGQQRDAFKSKVTFFSKLESAEGLRRGSPVYIAGVRGGSVVGVRLDESGLVTVTFDVVAANRHLLRGEPGGPHPSTVPQGKPRGSMASIGGQGLLGDKMLEISVGSTSLPEWPTDAPLPARSGSDLFLEAEKAMNEVRTTAENLRRVTEPLAEGDFGQDLGAIAKNVAEISRMWAEGDGTVQRLMTDPKTADSVSAAIDEIRATGAALSRSARRVDAIVAEIERGEGSAHELIYGDTLKDSVGRVGDAGQELAAILREVREGDGALHDLIYGKEGKSMISNLEDASADIAAITADVRAGKGTIGSLLVDPSVYDDLKRLLGDLERNEILRALVRYSIKRDEEAGP
jgi:phospholipid/cholesterol/gamma-HCH transport system substrate-binding protein